MKVLKNKNETKPQKILDPANELNEVTAKESITYPKRIITSAKSIR